MKALPWTQRRLQATANMSSSLSPAGTGGHSVPLFVYLAIIAIH